MKKLAIISVAMGAAFLAIALYVQLHLVPVVELREAEMELNFANELQNLDNPSYDNTATVLFLEANDQKMTYSIIVLFGGALVALLGIVAGIKKQSLGWIGAVLGLTAFVIGALHGTHMFS